MTAGVRPGDFQLVFFYYLFCFYLWQFCRMNTAKRDSFFCVNSCKLSWWCVLSWHWVMRFAALRESAQAEGRAGLQVTTKLVRLIGEKKEKIFKKKSRRIYSPHFAVVSSVCRNFSVFSLCFTCSFSCFHSPFLFHFISCCNQNSQK